jgi:hypothetical protein
VLPAWVVAVTVGWGLRPARAKLNQLPVVRTALDLGVNLIDTAEVYGTEAIVGKAIEGVRRDRVILATKKLPPSADHTDPVGELRRGLEQSLRRLRTDYVDIYFLHGVSPKQYYYAYETFVPSLQRMRDEGKIRAVGITEAFTRDPAAPHVTTGARSNVLGRHDGGLQPFEPLGASAGISANHQAAYRCARYVCRAAGVEPARLHSACCWPTCARITKLLPMPVTVTTP